MGGNTKLLKNFSESKLNPCYQINSLSSQIISFYDITFFFYPQTKVKTVILPKLDFLLTVN